MSISFPILRKAAPAALAIAFGLIAAPAMAGGGTGGGGGGEDEHNTYVFVWNDATDSLTGNTYKNDHLIASITPQTESYSGLYKLWNDAGLKDDVNVRFNIYEANGALSDTLSISGNKSREGGDQQGQFVGQHEDGQGHGRALQLMFQSDVKGQQLSPLTEAFRLNETGLPQTVLQFTATNGDKYKFQFVSDVEPVPEPGAYLMMLTGLSLLWLLPRRRKN